MTFDAERGGWLQAARQDARLAIIGLLERHPFINQQEMASLLPNVSVARLRNVLVTLKYEGIITQSKFGYSLAQK